MSELKFPFKFRAFGLVPIYTARSSGEDSVQVSWYNFEGELRSRMYNLSDVTYFVSKDVWVLEDSEQITVSITQDEYDSLIDEINMLRELVAELTAVKFEQQFKPISEMTLEDWRQAERERWVFQTEHRGLVTVCDVDSDLQDLIPIQLESGEGNTWYVGLDGGDIDQEGWTVVKRVK